MTTRTCRATIGAMLRRLICGLRRRHEWTITGDALICRNCSAELRESVRHPQKVSDTLAGRAGRA